MESVSPFSSIAIFFCSEIKLVEKGKNKIKSKLLLQFVYDAAVDFIKGKEKATMKKNVYDVQVRKKEPPHPIRVAKTIDVIARIIFPAAYAIFLLFFFTYYTHKE